MEKRDYYFDNAKFILIFLVVFGHLLRTFIFEHELIYAVYKTIYTFHMPAFVLISGFFARGIYKKGYVGKLTKKLILPYLIFQGVYSIFYFYLNGKEKFTFDLLDPHWSLWFLISLFCWNIMLLFYAKFKPFSGMALAVLAGLFVGFIDDISNYLSLSRTFVFFPMFLAGYYLQKPQLEKLLTIRFKVISLAVFAIIFAGFYLYPEFDYKWLLGSKPYSELLSSAFIGMGVRLGFYVLSFITIASFLAMVPAGRYFFTTLGKRTLYVYLLHGFFVQLFRESGIAGYFTEFENYFLLIGMSLLLTFTLSSQFIASLTQPVIELSTTRFRILLAKAKAIFQHVATYKLHSFDKY